ncbi:unnamed protein product, partial [Ectocarpus sp. 4 AP-2014]
MKNKTHRQRAEDPGILAPWREALGERVGSHRTWSEGDSRKYQRAPMKTPRKAGNARPPSSETYRLALRPTLPLAST